MSIPPSHPAGDADAHTHLGLTCKPELKRGVLNDPSDRFIVLASDGCWDYMDEGDVARVVDDAGDDAHVAVRNVVLEAKRRWDASTDRRRDDITALVIMLRFGTHADADAAELESRGVSSGNDSRPAPASALTAAVAEGGGAVSGGANPQGGEGKSAVSTNGNEKSTPAAANASAAPAAVVIKDVTGLDGDSCDAGSRLGMRAPSAVRVGDPSPASSSSAAVGVVSSSTAGEPILPVQPPESALNGGPAALEALPPGMLVSPKHTAEPPSPSAASVTVAAAGPL